jgi:hypothetical protein
MRGRLEWYSLTDKTCVVCPLEVETFQKLKEISGKHNTYIQRPFYKHVHCTEYKGHSKHCTVYNTRNDPN